MNQSIVFLTLLATFVTAGTAIASEQAGGHRDRSEYAGERHRPDGGAELVAERMAEYLGLDETQLQSVKNVMAAARPEFESLRERARANREALRALAVSDPNYGARLQDLSAENGALAAARTLLHGRVKADLADVLTANQLQRLDDWQERRGDRGMPGSWRGSH